MCYGADAIYARQSVDRADSISIESQIERCKAEVINGPPQIFIDKGYSGKNTDRPDFQRMMAEIQAGKIRRVIVYRLDRISRSTLDFATMIEAFQKYNVDFSSTTEKFDTGTPVGKAMLMTVMVFAQLERETIQQRVVDAYLSRSRRGFYMGGVVPFGFQLEGTLIEGKKTKMYAAIPEELKIVRLVYELYAQPQVSLGDVVKYLTAHGVKRKDGKDYTRSGIRNIVVNPAYVRADHSIYEFYKAQGATVENDLSDFIGINGAYLYSGNGNGAKTTSLDSATLVLAPHEGVVDSGTWIKCRSKCLNNRMVAKPIKAKATWLAGKIKCASCGYALTAKTYHCKTKKDNRYYLCTHRYSSGNCSFGSLDADVVDEAVYQEISKKLSEFKTLSRAEQKTANLQVVKLTARIEQMDQEISTLLDRIADANSTVMSYINSRVAALDKEKKQLHAELLRLSESDAGSLKQISDYMERWDEISLEDKMTVVDCVIESIHASKEKIKIIWKI